MVAQAKNGATDAIKSKAQEVANNLKKLNDTLGDEKAWEDMKRKERKAKLEEIPATISGYKEDFNKTLMAESTKMGIDKKVSAAISEVIKLLDGVAATVAEVDKKVAEASVVKSEEKEKEVKAEEEKKDEDKKDDTTSYIEIASGNVKKHNLSKKGPNLDKIKKFQENYVALKLSPEIKADGLYGKNTEAAILKAAQMLDGLTGSDLAKATDNGKKMTPEVQAGLQKFLDNKDKIKDLIK
jgi:peptidoglycan hydrolase-like protein with peptidoglycan-binding domain